MDNGRNLNTRRGAAERLEQPELLAQPALPAKSELVVAIRTFATRPTFFVVTALFVIARCWQNVGTRVLRGPDTRDYVAASEAPLFSRTVWFGKRPPLYGLFIRTMGNNDAAIVWSQTVLSIVAWTFLGLVVASLIVSSWFRGCAFAAVLFVGLGLNVSMWDRVVSTENVSLSLLAVFVGTLLALVASPTRRSALALCAVMVPFAMVRDSNGLMLMLLFIGLVPWCVRRSPSRSSARIVAAGLLVVVTAGMTSSSVGNRFNEPLRNVVTMRLAHDTEARAFLERRGLRLDARIWNQIKGECVALTPVAGCLTLADPDFFAWVETDGRTAYEQWLLAHPINTLRDPIRHLHGVVTRKLIVDHYAQINSPISRFAEKTAPPKNPILLWGLFAASLAMMVGLAFRQPSIRRVAWTCGCLVVSVVPHIVLTWNSDGMEQERHALTAAILLRISIVVAVLIGVDRLLCSRERIAKALREC